MEFLKTIISRHFWKVSLWCYFSLAIPFYGLVFLILQGARPLPDYDDYLRMGWSIFFYFFAFSFISMPSYYLANKKGKGDVFFFAKYAFVLGALIAFLVLASGSITFVEDMTVYRVFIHIIAYGLYASVYGGFFALFYRKIRK